LTTIAATQRRSLATVATAPRFRPQRLWFWTSYVETTGGHGPSRG